MSERTIAEPLSGDEVLEVICDKIRMALRKDCNLNPALAYEAFSGEISISLRLKDSGRAPEVKASVSVRSEEPVLEDTFLEQTEIALQEMPPNVVRQQAGLPLPTLVEDQNGRREVRKVRYARQRSGEDKAVEDEPAI